MDQKKLLLPYNFTDKDKAALDFVISNYAGNEDVSVTVFHTYVPVPEVVISSNTVMERMSSNLSFLRQKVVEQEGKMAEVKQLLISGGFQDSQVNYLYLPKRRDVAREIITLVREEEFNIIVLNRSRKVTSFFKANVFNKVVSTLENVLVCIVL